MNEVVSKIADFLYREFDSFAMDEAKSKELAEKLAEKLDISELGIYLVQRGDRVMFNSEEYFTVIVAARDEEEARKMPPSYKDGNWDGEPWDRWVDKDKISMLSVTLLGAAKRRNISRGIIYRI